MRPCKKIRRDDLPGWSWRCRTVRSPRCRCSRTFGSRGAKARPIARYYLVAHRPHIWSFSQRLWHNKWLIAGQRALIDVIRLFSHGFIFTTALPPALLAGAQAATEYHSTHPGGRALLQRRAASVKAELHDLGFPVITNSSHIVPLMVGDATACKAAADSLYNDFGIYVQPIGAPSPAVGQERLRIAPTGHHTAEHHGHLVSALKDVWYRLGLPWEQYWRKSGSRFFTNIAAKSQSPLRTKEQLQAAERHQTI